MKASFESKKPKSLHPSWFTSCIDLEAAYANLSRFGLAGKLIEYDKPSKLLETNSSLAKLVAELVQLQEELLPGFQQISIIM